MPHAAENENRVKRYLTSPCCVVIMRKLFRGVAQMVARMVRDHEAASSSLATPTKTRPVCKTQTGLFCLFIKLEAALPSSSLLLIETTKSTDRSRCFFPGAGDEARTRYLHLGKVALYRMSYARMGANKSYITTLSAFVKSFFRTVCRYS